MRDLIIVGGGPAGLTAGLYAARARVDVVLFERMAPGGQVLLTDIVENYPGFPDGISGFELMDKMKRQAESFGLPIENREVRGFTLSPDNKVVSTDKGDEQTKALILACGANPKKLGIEGEQLLIGKGVSYCATCDGPFYRDQEVAVIGGGDTAVEEALFLTRFASKVYLIHRRDQLRATKILQERVIGHEKVHILWDTIPVKILGQTGVEGIEIQNVKTGKTSVLRVQGVFVFIGFEPNSELIKGLLELDDRGFIITNAEMETSVPGVFAAGDIRSKNLRQISNAVGEGATAAFAAERYLENIHG
ncbi:MAG: thioredoxin-disulfide reductase [Deltaproteobacteria bacterium]|nr:MAG: thioredoxin-disulfide reductase [Deltaproteobacteria bacterium]